LLDKVVLEGEGFLLVADEDGFEVGNFARERAGFGVDPARLEEVGTNTAPEGGGFADVENSAGRVFEQVDAGRIGEQIGDFFGFHGGVELQNVRPLTSY
jgi:hypothetical protein